MTGMTQQELNYLQSVLNAGGYSSSYGDVGPALAQSIASKAAMGQLGSTTNVTVVERPLIFNQQFLGPVSLIPVTEANIIDAGSF